MHDVLYLNLPNKNTSTNTNVPNIGYFTGKLNFFARVQPFHVHKIIFHVFPNTNVSNIGYSAWKLHFFPAVPCHSDAYLIFVTKKCGKISTFCTWQIWKNLKSPSLCLEFMVFCCILHCFVAICILYFCAISAVLSQNRFVAIYALLCGEHFSQK